MHYLVYNVTFSFGIKVQQLYCMSCLCTLSLSQLIDKQQRDLVDLQLQYCLKHV